MWGRFTLHTSADLLLSRFELPELSFEYVPNYNVAPTQEVLTVTGGNGNLRPSLMHWGLIPAWQGANRPLINARLETLAQRKTFSGLVDAHRCLILADGFYEWQTENSRKHPVYITLESGEPFAFAGLWEPGDEPRCTIITTAANPFIKPIHHRMPVILTPGMEKRWLSADPFRSIQAELNAMAAPDMKYFRVSTLVNSPRNNDPSCIQPLN